MYIYNFFINFIKCLCILQYTIRKNKKSIHDMIQVLTTMPYTTIWSESHPFIGIMYGGQSFTNQAILDELHTHTNEGDRGVRESQ